MRLGIPDEEFIRGKVPMTKEEIRILSVVKLQLDNDSVVYDIGAGTGSVAVEMAGQCPKGMVYAIEKNPEAVSLIGQNKDKFGVCNMEIVEGTAPQCLSDLPKPTHAFIGGSSGNLLEIIQTVREKNSNARFVVNAVTLETLAQLQKIPEEFPEYADMEVVQVGVSKSRAVGNYHLMCAENPVYVAEFGGGAMQ